MSFVIHLLNFYFKKKMLIWRRGRLSVFTINWQSIIIFQFIAIQKAKVFQL